jgi:solute carrier family 25 protein 44
MTTAVGSPQFIRTIEWDMMDKSKFFPLSMLSTFSVRCVLYPLTVIKTRLQLQRHDQMYRGKNIFKSQNCGYAIKMTNNFYRHFFNACFVVIELY